MIDINKKRIPIILYGIVHTSHFSKGYKAETEDLLAKKIEFAQNGTFDYLSTLDIIPKTVHISGRDVFYKLNDATTAAKINFSLDYYMLHDASFEKHREIVSSLAKQMHHLERLKNKINSSSGHFQVLRHPVGRTIKIYAGSITAQTKDELIQKTKQTLWNLIKEDESSNTVTTEFNLRNIDFFQTPEGFEAHYSYILYHSNRVSKKVDSSNPYITKNTDDGRDE